MNRAAWMLTGAPYCHARVAEAVRKGDLLHPVRAGLSCADCGAPAIEYDHRDYSAPLDVAPVCRRCNLRRGPAKPREWSGPGEIKRRLANTCRQRIAPWAQAWCLEIAEREVAEAITASGGTLSAHDLRPDLYPRESEAA